jgi:hypothetical protein
MESPAKERNLAIRSRISRPAVEETIRAGKPFDKSRTGAAAVSAAPGPSGENPPARPRAIAQRAETRRVTSSS